MANEKVELLREVWHYMRERKRWWLGPLIFLLVLIGILLVFAETSVIAPFIYTIF
ncbi:hypothetical protein HYW30_00210 [Candidatus Azambacteria bacterium]|nr:hypothetical protein [Candidatus Azambacteria bacterium]